MARGGRARGARGAGVASVLALTLVLVCGCTGDGESAAFHREFADDPAVESMELTSHDNQPFTGGVSGDVFVREGVRDEEFVELTERVGEYTRENEDRMRGRVSLVLGGFEAIVTGDETADEDAAHLLLDLRDDARVTSATVGEDWLAVTGTGAVEAIELARELPARLDGAAPSRRLALSVRSDDGAVVVSGPGAATDAVRLWDDLRAHVPLTGIRVQEDDRVVVALQHEAHLARARQALAESGLDGETPIAFASDLIRLGDSDGEDARLLLSRLDEASLARIAFVWISETRVQVAVRSDADLSALVDEVDAALPSRVTVAELVRDGDLDTRVSVRPASADTEEAE